MITVLITCTRQHFLNYNFNYKCTNLAVFGYRVVLVYIMIYKYYIILY